MFLCILKTLVLVFFLYGIYSGIVTIFEVIDRKKFTQCVFIDMDKISNVEEAVYTVFLHHPDTEIFIVCHGDTPEGTRKIISNLCKKYDCVYSLEDK